jgi:hypothetical protein
MPGKGQDNDKNGTPRAEHRKRAESEIRQYVDSRLCSLIVLRAMTDADEFSQLIDASEGSGCKR